ncbi:RAD51-associated protein 1 [Silurus asotus]|uniref:RAD51-associated protein 1 n=1 Tax=Silurus asotus TaxID=30991 RepID=A0AAD5FBX1_SILAS|nr:RAD51-associated protein 1 [Silurus asotus]
MDSCICLTDEDFATAKPPPNKKARASAKECPEDKTRKHEILDSAAKEHKESFATTNCFLFQKDEAPPCNTSEDTPPLLSNCSVDVQCMGSDNITSEQTPSSGVSTKTQQRCPSQDEEYRPRNTPGTSAHTFTMLSMMAIKSCIFPESDSEFSELDESEDEEYTVKRKRENVKRAKSEKKASPKTVKKEKKPAKTPKTKTQARGKDTALSSPGVRSPAAGQRFSAPNRTPTTPPMSKSALHTSPGGGKMPKWTPPGNSL